MNIHKKPRINRQDRLKITFPGSAYPKIFQQYTPATHTEAVHCQGVLLGVFHPYLWPPKAPRSTLGEGRQTSRQPTDTSTPETGGGQNYLARHRSCLKKIKGNTTARWDLQLNSTDKNACITARNQCSQWKSKVSAVPQWTDVLKVANQ